MSGSKKSGLVLIVLLAITLTAPSISHVQADSGTFYVSHSYDDAYEDGMGTFSYVAPRVYLFSYIDPNSGNYRCGGVRFPSVNIPQGSTVISANFTARYTASVINHVVYGNDVGNAQNFFDNQNILSQANRPRTTASISWVQDNIPSAWYTKTGFESIIQEIVNRGDWASGNAIVLLFIANTDINKYGEFLSYDLSSGWACYLDIEWTPPLEDFIDNSGIEASDITPDDKQWFFLNTSMEIRMNTSTFLFNRIDLDPDGLNISCSYTNATDTFVEENDPNNYLELDTITSTKTDVNSTNIRIDYYIMFHHNVTKDGAYNVTVYSTASGGLNDTDTFTNVFTLTIREPLSPTELFGSGFNATSPYVELHWNHSLVNAHFFEIQNSTDSESWTYLGQSTIANYTDTQVVNGTKRYYKVRACFQLDNVWSNSSWTDVNFEKVHFLLGGAPPVDDYSIIFLAIGLILMLSIAFLYVKSR